MTDRRLRELRLLADGAGRHEEARALADLALALETLVRIRDDATAPAHVRRCAGEAWAKIVWADWPEPPTPE